MNTNAWLPGVGQCWATFDTFKSKSKRDYEASQANKRPGYIQHTVGEFKPTSKPTVYWLSIHTKEKFDEATIRPAQR